MLLGQGIDVNRKRPRGWRALHHAIARDNALDILDLLLDHGADPTLPEEGVSAVAMAARKGRGDVLASLEQRGIPIALQGVDQLIAACARNDAAGIRVIAEREPHLVGEVVAQGRTLLAEFAGTGNRDGVGHLLDLGISVGALYEGEATMSS